MINMKRWKSLILILGFVTPAVILLTIVVIRISGRVSLATIQKEMNVWNHQWSDQKYLPITDTNFPSQVRKLVEASSEGLKFDRDQKLSLIIELVTFFQAYHKGTYEAYRAFRIPRGIPFSWKTKNAFGSLDDVITSYGLPNILHEISMEKKYQACLIAVSGDGTVFSNLLTAVCFEQSRIVFQQCTNPVLGWDTGNINRNTLRYDKLLSEVYFTGFGQVSQKLKYSFIQFEEDSLDDLANRGERVTVADCFLLIKRRTPFPILPVILRLYWHPKKMKWLPDDVVACDAMQEKNECMPIF